MKQLSKLIFGIFLVILALFSPASKASTVTLQSEVIGLKGSALKNADERLSLLQLTYADNLTENHVQAFYKNAPKNIREAIAPFGYFRATIRSQLLHQGHIWIARFYVEPGPRLQITRLSIRVTGPGADNPAIQKLLVNLPIAEGKPFNTDKYNKAIQDLFQTANNQGYLKAVLVKKEILIDLKKYTAVITLHLDTGQQYYIGQITFHQDTFADKFLARFETFKEGEPFSSQKLLKFQQNLNDSKYFQSAEVTPKINEAENYRVPVDVTLKPVKARRYDIGLGYGTYTGPRLTLGANFRRLTESGHHANVQLKLSHVLTGLAAQYVIPGANPLTDEYAFGASKERFLPKNGKSNSQSIYVSAAKKFNDWKATVSLTKLRENFYIYRSFSSHNSHELYPSLILTRLVTDNVMNPRNGSRLDLILRGATNQFGSTNTFIQAEMKGKYIFSPTDISRVILRANFGYTATTEVSKFPLSLRFFAGGLDSVRGFSYTEFGPGRYLKVGSVEYQHRIKGDWDGAVFYDVGTASNHVGATMGQGVGVGAIYNSVVGPIKAYVGVGMLKSKGRHFNFQFSVGPDL